MTEREARTEMVKVCKRLYQKEYVTAYDGNVSIKLNSNRFLMTPSGFCKGDLTERDLIVCDNEGRKLSGAYDVTSEVVMHLEAFRQRPDINAVIHAHPPLATAFSLAGISIARCILPEVIFTLGSIPTTEYATPTTPENADIIRDLIKTHDAMILDRHGSLTVGKNIWSAYFKLEKIEHTAKITFVARQLGSIKTLTSEQLKPVVAIAEKLGVQSAVQDCLNCGACGKEVSECTVNQYPDKNENVIENVSNVITNEILKTYG